jgi:hypothetical protein
MGTAASTAPKAGPLGYGMGPVAVAGGITLLCAFGLMGGGYGVIANAFAPSAIHAVPALGANGTDEAPAANDGAGTSPAGPTTPPERVSAPEVAQLADTVYLIKWGDTLSQISLDTGVSVERLAEHNSISNVDLIYADALLRIPYVLIPGEAGAAAPTK